MKTITKMLAIALVTSLLGLAISAKADYSITVSPVVSSTATTPGASGTSLFNVSFGTSGGTYNFNSSSLTAYNLDTYVVVAGSSSPFSSLAIAAVSGAPSLASGSHFTAGNTYQYQVSWTLKNSGSIPSLTTDYGIQLGVTVKNGVNFFNSSGTEYFTAAISPVPEPPQVVAGFMLFGCGALVFTGRRWLKQQST